MSNFLWRYLIVGLFVMLPMAIFPEGSKLLRYPDIHENMIVFCYGGDIYTATAAGQQVNRLTDWPGEEKLPKFSPDGKYIAFTADRGGNVDVYVIPMNGGEAKRLTYDPNEDEIVDWHPDGKRIVFRSVSSSFSYRFNRLHLVAAAGGLPQVMELPEAESSDFNEAGDRIAFCRTGTKERNLKGYRGGMAPNIWIYDFKEKKSELIVADGSVNHHPVWLGDTVYFISDRSADHMQNLWAYDSKTDEIRQVTHYEDWGVKWPSKGKNQIIYEMGGELYLYSLKNNAHTKIKIEITLPQSAFVRKINGAGSNLFAYDSALAPDGKRVIACVRGDLFLYDTESEKWMNLTATSGQRERGAVWSPDGKTIAFISDESGEEQIFLKDIEKNNGQRMVSNCSKQYLRNLNWSPDGKKIGYSDQKSCHFFIDLDAKTTKKVFFDAYNGNKNFVGASWSPDSNWLVFECHGANRLRAIQLYSIQENKTHFVTDGKSDDFGPVFDIRGNYLYWVSDRKVNTEFGGAGNNWIYYQSNPSIILAVTLRSDLLSPLANDMNIENGSSRKQTGDLKIDLEGLGGRLTALPVDDSHYSDLQSTNGKLIYTSKPDGHEPSVKMFDFGEMTECILMNNADYCKLSAAGNKVLCVNGGALSLLDLKPDLKREDGLLNLSGITMSIDLKQEWKQIFNEAWRLQRSFCFDETLHGVDWPAIKARYEKLLPHVSDRKALNYLIEEMYSELGYGHNEISGGDFPVEQDSHDGVLGVDLQWDLKRKAYHITHIYPGQNWEPSRVSPLTLPGMNVRTGDYIIAIDGKKLTAGVNPYSLLVDKADTEVAVTIGRSANAGDIRTLRVKARKAAHGEEDFLRYDQWVQHNAERVRKASAGRIGYVHIPDTYLFGIESFANGYFSQLDKEAFIVDVRYNSGGYSPALMIECLSQVQEFIWKTPHGKVNLDEPDRASYGPKVCLINEWASSGGDMFAQIFRLKGDGLLIGKRTAGSLAGEGGSYLIDKGYAGYPIIGSVDEEGRPFIENVGISPDIDVTNLPEDLMKGKDAQLERAIEELLKKLNSKR